MPKIIVRDRFYMEQMYNAGEVYQIGDATLVMMKEKRITHHIERLDKPDEEIQKAVEADLEAETVAQLRGRLEDLGIPYSGKEKKADVIAMLQKAIQDQV